MSGIFLVTSIGPFHTNVGAAFGTFTTRQDVSPRQTSDELPVVQGGVPVKNTKIKIEADGEFSTTGTPTLALGFYIGTQAASITTVLAESAAITTGTAVVWPWRLEYDGIFTASGTAGSVRGGGVLYLGTALTTFAITPIPVTAALRTITWDTTIARAIGVCATYSASSASNTVTTNNLRVCLWN